MRKPIVALLSIFVLACVSAFADTATVEFYDENGNLLTEADVLAYSDNGTQKFTPSPTGQYDVNMTPGQKVTFILTDRQNEFNPATVIPPVDLEETIQVTVLSPNVLCADGIPINVGDTVAGDTTGAGNDPNNDTGGFCGTTITSGGDMDWYQVTPAADTSITASTCNQASYDTKISVFCQDCDSADFLCIGGNDDGPGCAAFSSSFTWCARGGSTYHIMIHGFLGASGAYNLSLIDNGPCAANEDCAPIIPPDPEGACCQDNCDVLDGQLQAILDECEDVTCSSETEADCLAAGGTYNGDDSECVTLGAEGATYSSPGGVDIPDNDPGGVRDEIIVPAGGPASIGDIDADIFIPHTWIGDLRVALTHKDTGTEVVLWQRNCGSSNLLDILSDDAGTQTFCGPAGGATTGSIPPALTNGFSSFMSDFNGEGSEGTWSLFVDDNFSADTGSVGTWSIIIREGVFNCAGCTAGTGGGGGDEQHVTICHAPPGNPANAQTLTIGAPAANAHLAQHPGDHMGPCPTNGADPDSLNILGNQAGDDDLVDIFMGVNPTDEPTSNRGVRDETRGLKSIR